MKTVKGIIFSLVLVLMACEDSNLPLECGTDLICTEQFEMVTFNPTDSENQPLILNNFYSQNLDNGNIYNFDEHRGAFSDTTYIIITDAEMDEVQSEGTIIRFFGEKDGQLVVQEDFKIGHDCCHIVPISGPGIGN